MIRPAPSSIAIAFAIVLADSPVATSQTTSTPSIRDSTINTIAGEIAERKKTGDPRATLSTGETDLFALALQQGSLVRLLQDYEEQRSDEQIGATASASGTTTLVSKGSVPRVLAFAMENGAVTRNLSGTTVTFRGNLAGIFDAVAGKPFVAMTATDVDAAHDILERLSLSASFDTSRGVTQGEQPTFTGDRQQLSQWSFRAQVIDRRDPMRFEFRNEWQTLTNGALNSVAQAANRLQAALNTNQAFLTWLQETQETIRPLGPDSSAIAATLRTQLDRIPSTTLRELADYDRATTSYVEAHGRILDKVASGLQVAVEYTNDRPVTAPKTSNVRLIGSVGGYVDLTGNASVTLFDEIPAGATRRARDFQLSAEISVRLGTVETTGPFVLAFSGKYLHQFEDSFDENGVMLPNTAGTRVIGQVKLTVPVKGSGVRMPLSVTFANRTELIKEKEIRGNIGITYDLDTLFARFKP